MNLVLSLVTAMAFSPNANAKDWIDMTELYLINPSFDGNDFTTGWQGTPFGSASPMENAEHYGKTFDTYQDLAGLTPGLYRLSLNAYYRSGSAQDDYDHFRDDAESFQRASLYARSSSQEFNSPIVLASSAALAETLGGSASEVWTEGIVGGNWWGGGHGEGDLLYIPNNMEAAYYWFEAGYYQNIVSDIVVEEDGKLRIGIRKLDYIGSDWVCLDNWKLEFWGDKVNVTAIELDQTEMTLQFGETASLTATVVPADATMQKVIWTSSDESVARIDQEGNIYAVGKGTCEIIVCAKDDMEVKAVCTVTVVRDDIVFGSLVINEIQSKNVDMFLDPSFNYGGWIEIYNPTNQTIGLGGFYVSDDPDNLKKYRLSEDMGSVPAHEFKNIWFDHYTRYGKAYLQVPTKLDCDGGAIYLSDNYGNLIASAEYPAGIGRAAWARMRDGSDQWGWTSTPTPEASNLGTFCTEQLNAPEVDTDGCIFEDGETFQVKVTIPTGTQLYYTTDGTTPTPTNGERSLRGTFNVSKTTVYRWRLFREGKLPSPVTTRSYIKRNKNYTLPIVSIVTDPDNIYGDDYGVDVRGNGNGRSGNGTSYAVNYNMDWDRPVSFEYIEQEPKENTDGYFQQEADFSISGGWSRKQTPRSFKIKATKKYDLNSLDYQFFDDKPYNKNKALLFRNGGNDGHAQSRIKDAAIHQMVKRSGLYCDLQDWNPTHVFINGQYRGMQNMRQPSNKHLAYAGYGIDTDEIDAFEMSVDSGYVQSAGTRDAFERWYELAKNAADDEVYQQLCDLVDMDEYCNYMAVQFNLQNWDWPHNNLKGFRERREGAKFHMVLFDVDNVFEQNIGNPFTSFKNRKTYTFYPIFEWGNKQLTLEVEHVTIFLNMLQNPKFRKKFIDTYCLVNGSVFEPERCAAIVDEMTEILRQPMSLEGYTNNLVNQANTLKRNFNYDRQNTAIRYIQEFNEMGLRNTEAQHVSLSSNIDEGRILVNGMNVPTGKFEGGLFSPITLKAEAPAGKRFLGWQTDVVSSEIRTNIFGFGSTWNYYDQGSLDETAWNQEGYDDSHWQQGRGGFGYNVRSNSERESTTLDYGGNSQNKRPTYYFRKHFTLDEMPAEDATITLSTRNDDAYIIYVNGEEVAVSRIWSGAGYSDFATSYGPDPYDQTTVNIPVSLLKQGENLIAVEVHNNSATSTDIYWDGRLEMVEVNTNEGGNFFSTDAEIKMPASGDLSLIAIFADETDEAVLLASGNVPVKVNEVSAGNSMNINDHFKKDDWIELYNNTDDDIDIAGMYLSDKAKNPLKYQIPADIEGLNTIIPARGHLVVWASKREIIGRDIHTNFKLDNEEGAMVILTAQDETWSDTLRYDMHGGQESYGRYPDGGQNVYHMTEPTIAAQNKLSMYSTFAYTYIYTGEKPVLPEDPDHIEQTLAADLQSVEYFNTAGMAMGSKRETLQPGIYVVKYRMNDGTIITRKQVIK